MIVLARSLSYPGLVTLSVISPGWVLFYGAIALDKDVISCSNIAATGDRMIYLTLAVCALFIWQSVRIPTIESIASAWCAKDWSTLPQFTLVQKGERKPMQVSTRRGVRRMQARATFRFAGLHVTYYASAKGWAGLRFERRRNLVSTDLLFRKGQFVNWSSFETVRAVRTMTAERFALAGLLRVVERTYTSALEQGGRAATA